MLSGTRLYQEPWLIFSWHGSSPSSWSKMELEIIKTSFCPVTNWSCSLGNIQALSWIFFYLTRVSFIKLQLFSTRWVCGVVRVLKSSSFSYLQSCRVCVCVCVRALVPACSHLCYSLTLSSSSPSVLSLCPAESHFLGTNMKTRCSLILKSLKVLWDTDPKLQSMPQVPSFNYDKIHIT